MYKSAKEMTDLETCLRAEVGISHLVPRLSIGKSSKLTYDKIREKELKVMKFLVGILEQPQLLKHPETINFFNLSKFYMPLSHL